MAKSTTKKKHSKRSDSIESTLGEKRLFKPSKAFSEKARISSMAQYEKLYRASIKDPEKFFAKQAEELHWFKKWRKVLETKNPRLSKAGAGGGSFAFTQWFTGGEINACYNCIDRHLSSPRKNKAAIIWEGENFEQRTLTYSQLHREVSKAANVLKSLGVKTGDRVAIYMGMTPELAIAVLACARIGATHTVIFGGFSAEAIRDRVNDCDAKLIITADGAFRRGTIIDLKKNVDNAVTSGCPSVEKVLVLKRTANAVVMIAGRDVWWHEAMAEASANCPATPLDSEHPLYILYTSGTTGKPKGIVHTTAGYLLGTYLTMKYIFDIRDEDVFWCSADVGWVTGHSYVLYGPLANGATIVMYEGAPTYPAPDRFWDIIERHGATIFYTAPTAIRAFIRAGDEHSNKHDMSSLRLLGSVGEPINPEAWMWYHRVIGKGRCPIVDTWWQTETGAIMISPIPGAVPTIPGSATLPFFGVEPEVVRKDGTKCNPDEGGYLIIKKPWPSMLRGIYKDPERFQKQYFTEYPGLYFTGDGARQDKNGYFWIMGRVDDVINVSGHRLGTMEVESALVGHESVAEAAVVGRPDEIKGSALVAFVTLKKGWPADESLKEKLRNHVAEMIGSIAKPDDIRFSDALPKTRSGKIMRRLLRELASTGSVAGDTTTLEDFSVLEQLRAGEEE